MTSTESATSVYGVLAEVIDKVPPVDPQETTAAYSLRWLLAGGASLGLTLPTFALQPIRPPGDLDFVCQDASTADAISSLVKSQGIHCDAVLAECAFWGMRLDPNNLAGFAFVVPFSRPADRVLVPALHPAIILATKCVTDETALNPCIRQPKHVEDAQFLINFWNTHPEQTRGWNRAFDLALAGLPFHRRETAQREFYRLQGTTNPRLAGWGGSHNYPAWA